MLKHYLSITKPGIILGNLITVVGGFLLASRGDPQLFLLLWVLIGVGCIIGSGCVFNNYIEQATDRLMERTCNRVMAQKLISNLSALIFGSCLGVLGLLLLAFKTNLTTVIVATFGLFSYVVIYTLWLKPYSIRSTEIGSIAGAAPIVAGYTAVSGQIDSAAIILFCILCLWQIPHSFAITIFRFDDYKAANIPVFPVQRGILATKKMIVFYTILFIPATLLLTLCGYTGYWYLIIVGIVSILWLVQGIQGFSVKNDVIWARKLFGMSMIVICILSFMLSWNIVI